jgi:hypothetical protein
VLVCLFVWNFSVTRSTVLTEAERRTIPGLAKLFEGACPNCHNFEEILSRTERNFEEQNKVLESSMNYY